MAGFLSTYVQGKHASHYDLHTLIAMYKELSRRHATMTMMQYPCHVALKLCSKESGPFGGFFKETSEHDAVPFSLMASGYTTEVNTLT